MRPLLLHRDKKKNWYSHQNVDTTRGCEAEVVIWLHPPAEEQLKAVVPATQALSGRHFILDDVIEEVLAHEEMTDSILSALASRPEEEWDRNLTQMGSGTDEDRELLKRRLRELRRLANEKSASEKGA